MVHSDTTAPAPAGHRLHIQAIHDAIRAEERRLQAIHPWLARQDTLGAIYIFASLIAMAAIARHSIGGSLPAWITTLLMALPLSILHGESKKRKHLSKSSQIFVYPSLHKMSLRELTPGASSLLPPRMDSNKAWQTASNTCSTYSTKTTVAPYSKNSGNSC